jgi:hypothetical protein
MTWVFALPVLGFLVFLVVGAITGHVKLTSCCSIADPRRDSRMRDAFLEDATEPTGHPALPSSRVPDDAP